MSVLKPWPQTGASEVMSRHVRSVLGRTTPSPVAHRRVNHLKEIAWTRAKKKSATYPRRRFWHCFFSPVRSGLARKAATSQNTFPRFLAVLQCRHATVHLFVERTIPKVARRSGAAALATATTTAAATTVAPLDMSARFSFRVRGGRGCSTGGGLCCR